MKHGGKTDLADAGGNDAKLPSILTKSAARIGESFPLKTDFCHLGMRNKIETVEFTERKPDQTGFLPRLRFEKLRILNF